jgi:diguanylate cyclase (GGDEF)-like protein/PAS domain S-box-containing protein
MQYPSALNGSAKAMLARVHLLEQLVDAIALPIGLWNRESELIFCNAPYLAWAGRAREALIGRPLRDLYGEDAWVAAEPAFARAFAGETVIYERQLRHKPGAPWARIQVFPERDCDGTVKAVATVAYDIHADVQRWEKLEAMRARLSRFAENIPYPLTYVDTSYVLRFVNRAYCDTVKLRSEDLIGKSLESVRGSGRWRLHRPYFERARQGEATQFTRLADLPQGARWLRTSYVPDRDENGEVVGIYTVTTDVHELTLAQQRLRHQVEHDDLTGALSRRSMLDRLEVAASAGGSQPQALFFIDLDGFKAINDKLGHAAGDALLQAVSQALQSAVRADDAVGRFGGDEFLVLARVRDPAGAQTLAQHLVDAVAECAPLGSGKDRGGFGASIGYALAPIDAVNPMQLLKMADDAMYAAKRRGKHRALHAREAAELS